MATPMSAAQFLAALRAEGATVVEMGNWRTRNRNHKGPWGPVHGVMIHHTVTKGTARTVAICRDGHSELPGPLCHGVIAKDGRVHLVGYGRANHAGLGDPDVLAAVIAGTPLHCPPTARKVCGRFWLTHPDGSGQLTSPAVLAAALGPGGRQIPAEVLR